MNKKINKIPLSSTIALCAFLTACSGGGGSSEGKNGGGTGGGKGGTTPVKVEPYMKPAFRLFNAVGNGLYLTIQRGQATPPDFVSSVPNGGVWVTDGTSNGTKSLFSSAHMATPNQSIAYFDGGKKAIFTAKQFSYGYEPFVSDGTVQGTGMIKDITPGAADSLGANARFIEFKNKVYFTINSELYETDGTANGTKVILASTTIYRNPANVGYNVVGNAFRTNLFATKNGLLITLREQGANDTVLAEFFPEKTGNARFKIINNSTNLESVGVGILNGETYLLTIARGGTTGTQYKLSNSNLSEVFPNYNAFGFIPTPNSYQLPQGRFISDSPYNATILMQNAASATSRKFKLAQIKPDGTTHIITPKLPTGQGELKRIWSAFSNENGVYLSGSVVFQPGQRPKVYNVLYERDANGLLKDTPVALTIGSGTQQMESIMGANILSVGGESLIHLGNTAIFEGANNYTDTNTCQGQQLWSITGKSTIDKLKTINGNNVSGSNRCAIKANIVYSGPLGNDKIVFQAKSGENGSKGTELWVTDGTAANTKMLKDIAPNGGNGVTLTW